MTNKGWFKKVGNKLSEETKQKIRKFQLRRIKSKETCEKLSKSKMGHFVSEETKRKIGKANKGRKPTIETRRKMSEHKGKERYNWKGTTPENLKIRNGLEDFLKSG